ncbi:glycosyltransferase [Fulvivirga lutea]|uniref:Glycosyltransferase n=1 Tax=Fulvivirga lutea TaxID=2810512 RepID=A0A974WH81_9BACT|nr:glycosyltransferase [Fulvivirga lutea]QSE97177.1 glycosyltransferase [Fulvivirga lutea]
MVSILETISLIIIGVYLVWILVMICSFLWIRWTDHQLNKGQELRVSVIVPFRNEANNLLSLIESLNQLNYNRSFLEIILVDDHSNDRPDLGELPQEYKVLSLPVDMQGKKAALNFGINNSAGEIIVTTDADCIVQPEWINCIVSQFQKHQIQLVFGGVAFTNSETIFSRLQQIEFAPVIGVGAASNNIGAPIMCNGANLAFRKSAFEKVNGYEGNFHVASGDDEYLIHKISKVYNRSIVYIKSKEAVVRTQAPPTFTEFVSQRIRWASKWNSNKSFYKSSLAILVVLSSIFPILCLTLGIIQQSPLYLTLALSKIILDGIFTHLVLKSMRNSLNIFYYLITVILYPLYCLYIGVMANVKFYTWKGRKHKLG